MPAKKRNKNRRQADFQQHESEEVQDESLQGARSSGRDTDVDPNYHQFMSLQSGSRGASGYSEFQSHQQNISRQPSNRGPGGGVERGDQYFQQNIPQQQGSRGAGGRDPRSQQNVAWQQGSRDAGGGTDRGDPYSQQNVSRQQDSRGAGGRDPRSQQNVARQQGSRGAGGGADREDPYNQQNVSRQQDSRGAGGRDPRSQQNVAWQQGSRDAGGGTDRGDPYSQQNVSRQQDSRGAGGRDPRSQQNVAWQQGSKGEGGGRDRGDPYNQQNVSRQQDSRGADRGDPRSQQNVAWQQGSRGAGGGADRVDLKGQQVKSEYQEQTFQGDSQIAPPKKTAWKIPQEQIQVKPSMQNQPGPTISQSSTKTSFATSDKPLQGKQKKTDISKQTPDSHSHIVEDLSRLSLVEELQSEEISFEKDIQQLAITSPIISEQKTSDIPAEKNGTKKTASEKRYIKLNINVEISGGMKDKFLPARPDKGGSKGREIKLIINCSDVNISPMKIFMYDVELTKALVVGADKKERDVTPKMKKKDVLRGLVKEFLKSKSRQGLPVFDGGRIVFSNRLLEIPEGVQKLTFNYNYDDENVTCFMTIQHVKEDIKLENLKSYVESGRGRSDNMPQEALRALDTIIREMFLNKNLISIGGRAIFDPTTQVPLRCGPFVLMDGYGTSFRPHMWKIRFNFDKTQVVCHAPIKLYEYISQITNNFQGNYQQSLSKKIKLIRVRADHLKNKEGKPYVRKYTIFGISKQGANKEMIPDLKISVEQYFMKEYKIKLQYPHLPLIKVNPNKDTFLPIELLTVLPFQKVNDNDGRIVQEVIRHAAIPCFDRLDKLKKAVTSLGFSNRADIYLKNYMIEINPALINVSGRVIDGPEAIFGDGRKEFLRGGKWDFRAKKFVRPYDRTINWALFAVGTQRDYRNEGPLFSVEEGLPGAARKVGLKMEPSYQFEYVVWQKIDITVLDIIKNSEKEKKKLDLLVFIVNYDDDYKAVKRFGDMTYGIATQCMKYSNLQKQKNMDQYLANILLKINGKLGGRNWELSALQTFAPINRSFMIFGIDVTHPASNRNDLSKSIAAMVGSIDHNATIYSAVIRQQISKQEKSIIEVVVDMKEMVHSLLMNYYRVNRSLKPERLIFYRDGVSEGQFDIVFKHEVHAIQQACLSLENGYEPRITYIVVQKRHRIRFFPQDKRDEIGRSGNVPSGTVVDRDITHCREFDFYLCSHEGIQGCSKPAHYHVLLDDNNWGSNDLQSFTFWLCHLYARCSRSVSYPAPTYYAHLAAFRGRTLIGQMDDDSSSSVGSGSRAESFGDSKIIINNFHDDKLFFI